MANTDELAAFLTKKAKADPRVGRIVENAQVLDELKEHPAWRKLSELGDKQKDRIHQRLSDRMWSTGKPPSPEELAYYRGWIQATAWILGHPSNAMKALEDAAFAAWVMDQGETETEEAFT